MPDSPAALDTARPDLAVIHDDGTVETPGSITAPAATSAPAHVAARRDRSWLRTTLLIVSAFALVLVGTGIGYAMGSGTRADLAAAQTQVTSMSDQVSSLQSQLTAAEAANVSTGARAAACQTAMTASDALTAQWRNLWTDMGTLMDSTSQAQFDKTYAHMNAQYDAMQQEQGRVTALMQTCTGTPA